MIILDIVLWIFGLILVPAIAVSSAFSIKRKGFNFYDFSMILFCIVGELSIYIVLTPEYLLFLRGRLL